MAVLGAVATVLLTGAGLLAALIPGCDANDLQLPVVPSDTVCCDVAGALPQSLLRPTVSDFRGAQNLCYREQRRWQFAIFTGRSGSGGGGPGTFGCGSATEPVCVQRDISRCNVVCLGARTCFLRVPTDTPFIAEREESRKTKTDERAVIDTTGTSNSSQLRSGDNGETVLTNVTEAQRGRLNISSTENRNSRYRGVDINSRSLPTIADSLLRSDFPARRNPTMRDPLDRSGLSVFASGSGAASQAGKSFCCQLAESLAIQPLPGITNLIDCQTQCRIRDLGLAVHISAQQWGCGGNSFKAACNPLGTCDGCLADNSCMTVYRISLVSNIRTDSSQLAGTDFDVRRVDRSGQTETGRGRLGGRATLTSGRSLRTLTVDDVSGNQQTRREAQENKRITAEVGADGSLRGGVVVDGTVTIIGTSLTNRNTSRLDSDRSQRVLTTNLTRPGTQGIRRQSVDVDIAQNRDKTVQTAETSKEVNRTSSASGDQRGELLPGLLSPRDGSASLSAGERNISRLGQESVITSTVERSADNANQRTDEGDQRRTAASTATVRTDVERTGARNDTNIRTSGFATDDPQLGSVELRRREENSGSVMDQARATGSRTGGTRRTVTTCASCNGTTDLTERTRSDRQNQTTTHTEGVKRDVTKDTVVAAGSSLPSLAVTARDIRQAQTSDSASRGSGTTHDVLTEDTRRTGFRSRRNRTVVSVERNNGTDHVEEVEKVTVLRAVVL